MVKIDFATVMKAGKSGRPVFLTLFLNWCIKSFSMYAISVFFLGFLTPVTITALLLTLVLLFSFKGEVVTSNPLTIIWIATPLFVQTILIFALGYGAAKPLKLKYEDAAPAAMIGASNHFEVAIVTSVMLFGLSSGAALANGCRCSDRGPCHADACRIL